ncbi:hypothetical protein Salat_1703000 [Sesamum alatum]|uniref:Uncharacterized protein n=1 Tax=Sesamum alatum TaxID=300844 RepID=A0AAE1Y7V4_9LAMI|nr:hypothetical protein Salat_1703000 [Sesamum alatum]
MGVQLCIVLSRICGGTKCKFDFVDVFRISVEYLNTLGEKLGYQGPKIFYRLHLNTFRPLKYQTEILSFTEGYSPHNTVFTIYLVCGETPNVEPQTEINVNKGKGVVVDDGDDTDLADDEWDEVFKIVDSVAEGIGQGDGQVESQNQGDGEGSGDEASDHLFDSGLEDSGYEMADDETEEDRSVDGSGNEGSDSKESGEENVASSDSDETTSDDDVCLSEDDFQSVDGSNGDDRGPHTPNVPPTRASQQSVHRFTQCSTLSQSTCSGVPCLSKGGKKFVTMTNLTAAVGATSKKKKATKGKKAI